MTDFNKIMIEDVLKEIGEIRASLEAINFKLDASKTDLFNQDNQKELSPGMIKLLNIKKSNNELRLTFLRKVLSDFNKK